MVIDLIDLTSPDPRVDALDLRERDVTRGPSNPEIFTEAFGPVLNAEVSWFEDDAERFSDKFLERFVVKASEQQSVAVELARLVLPRREIVLKLGNSREYVLLARKSEVSEVFEREHLLTVRHDCVAQGEHNSLQRWLTLAVPDVKRQHV